MSAGGRTPSGGGGAEKPARAAARALLDRIGEHWDRATSRHHPTADVAARQVYDEMLRTSPENPAAFVREKLFDLWRNRFLTRLQNDTALRADLRNQAAISVWRSGDRLSIESITPAGSFVSIKLDVDHSAEGLSKATYRAISEGSFQPLVGLVRSASLTFVTQRENRNVLETLRNKNEAMGQVMQRPPRR
jgi:hypothetical protein